MIQLRDYQTDIIDRTRVEMKRHKRVLVQAPTGAGKTALASYMAGQARCRVWFVCHRAELVTQTSLTFSRFGIEHGFIAAGRKPDASHRVQVCSIDTLKNRLEYVEPPGLIIWDECHHLGAAGWTRVQEAYPDAYHVGLSATPQRLDGKGLREAFDSIVLGPAVGWLIENGHLSPYRAYAPSAPDMTGCRKQAGDFSVWDAEERASKPHLIGDAVAHWRKFADGLRTVAFCVTVRHSEAVCDAFNLAGIPSAHLDGNTHRSERERIVRAFADGQIQVLCNVALFGEGFDLSAIAQRDVTIDAVIQLRPTASLGLHLQQVGRALRPGPDKTAVILDHAGNIARHGLPDDPRGWTLDGQPKRAKDEPPDVPPPVTCPECFGQIRRPAPPACPYCGAFFARAPAIIETYSGELVEITRRQERKEQGSAKTLNDLIRLGVQRGYKNPRGWAYHVMAGRR